MTLDEAIQTLTYHEPSLTEDEPPHIRLAIKLGIEALILYQRCRNHQPVWLPMYLDGETPNPHSEQRVGIT